jgi:hypothetical protein
MFRFRRTRYLAPLVLLSTLLTPVAPAAAPTAAPGVAGLATSVRGFLDAPPLDVALYDRTAGRMLPLWTRDGEFYVVGEPGHEYEIRLRGASDARVLAVTSVDGINVVTGQQAALQQPGYVVDGHASATIDGWRKDLGEVASFVFTTQRHSYAARTGRPRDVGVIGVAMFREAPRAHAGALADRDAEAPDAAPREPAPTTTGAAESRARRETAPTAAPALGTGHGARRGSRVERTGFQRASATPDAVVRIYYDSRHNLVARGIVPDEAPLARRRPDPFPAGGFVPDP